MPGRKRRIRSYFRNYWPTFTIGLFCLVLTQGFAIAVPKLLRRATDAFESANSDIVFESAIGLVAAALLGAIARILSRILIFNSGRRVEFDLRNDIFSHLERLAPSFYQDMPVGQVMSRMVNDLTQVRLVLGPGLLNLTNTTLVYLVIIPLLFYSDWSLTLLCLIPLPILAVLGRAFAKRMYMLNRTAQEKLGALSTKVQENLSGVMTVRAYQREAGEMQTFLDLNNDYLQTNIQLAQLRGVMFPIMGLMGAFGSVTVLYFGGHRIVDGTMTIGQFLEFSLYLAMLTWPTIALGWMISMWQRGLAAMDRVNEIFGTEPTLVDGKKTTAHQGTIELRGLSHRYVPDGALALDGIQARIEPGELVVVVGRTGSGKSTLLKCLSRQLEVDPGSIFWDGADIVDLPLAHVRSRIGYAPQDAFLFSRTIYDNIAFGDPKASKQNVEAAAALAQIKTEIESFPEGYYTVVGERGITLSGGQRQRTTLARAFLVDAEVLILDDTLSAVDTETETEILKALNEESKKRTLIVATHRLACAAAANRILVLDDGRLVEQGTEAELLSLGGLYAQMHRRQRLRQALERAESQPASPVAVEGVV